MRQCSNPDAWPSRCCLAGAYTLTNPNPAQAVLDQSVLDQSAGISQEDTDRAFAATIYLNLVRYARGAHDPAIEAWLEEDDAKQVDAPML